MFGYRFFQNTFFLMIIQVWIHSIIDCSVQTEPKLWIHISVEKLKIAQEISTYRCGIRIQFITFRSYSKILKLHIQNTSLIKTEGTQSYVFAYIVLQYVYIETIIVRALKKQNLHLGLRYDYERSLNHKSRILWMILE